MFAQQTTAGSPRSGHRRGAGSRPRMTLASVVLIEMILASGIVVWTIIGTTWGASVMAVAAVVSMSIVPVGDGGSVAARAGRRLSYRWTRLRRRAAETAPAPFDIPIATRDRARFTGRPAETIGARWDGRTLVTVLRVDPGEEVPTFLTPAGAQPAVAAGQSVPIDVLAECISPYDIRLSSVEIISHGLRTRGYGPVTATYQRTLGPLPATAQRSVFVVIRLDPLDCPDAVARRGGGATGALRTATIATRRVAKRLTEHGLRVAILAAADITAVDTFLLDGASVGTAAEQWDSVRVGGLRMRSAAIDPGALATALDTVWSHPSASTTVTIRLRRNDNDDLEISGLVRFTDVDGRTPPPSWPPALRPLDGRQFDALTRSLPVATSPRVDRTIGSLTGSRATTAAGSLCVPAAGCGQLIGADRTGRAVALRLAGPGVPSVMVAADLPLLIQVVLRSVAVGISVVIHTDRPNRWASTISVVGDPGALALSTDRARPRGPVIMAVVDGSPRPPATPGVTVLTAVAPGTGPDRLTGDAVLLLRQNPRAPQDISVMTTTAEYGVTMVATPDEWRLIAPAERSVTDNVTPPIRL